MIRPSLAEMKEELLLNGGGVLFPESNVAPGTYGYALYALEMDGMMTKRSELRRLDPIRWANVTIFETTPKGEAAREMLK